MLSNSRAAFAKPFSPAIVAVYLGEMLAMWVRVAAAFVFILLPTALHAQAEKRIALLIGNQGYGSETGRLANPHNDVALLERTLKAFGFEVRTVRDAGLAGMHQAVARESANVVSHHGAPISSRPAWAMAD